MNALETFLKRNEIKKTELAKYLGIVPSNISWYCKTGSPLPEAHIKKILKNKSGWDVAPLFDMAESRANPINMQEIHDLLVRVLENQAKILMLLSK